MNKKLTYYESTYKTDDNLSEYKWLEEKNSLIYSERNYFTEEAIFWV